MSSPPEELSPEVRELWIELTLLDEKMAPLIREFATSSLSYRVCGQKLRDMELKGIQLSAMKAYRGALALRIHFLEQEKNTNA